MNNLHIEFTPGNEAKGSGQDICAPNNEQVQDSDGRGTKHKTVAVSEAACHATNL